MVPQAELLGRGVVLEAALQQLHHVVLVRAAQHAEVLQVADVRLLVLAEGDGGDHCGPLQPQGQELGRGVGVG